MKKILSILLILSAAWFSGCSTLQPGADPVVVRAEQSIAVANATLDAVVAIDDSNRSFWRTNAPGFHDFCEWLREPVTVKSHAPNGPSGTDSGTDPRGIAMIESANTVRLAYKKSRSSSDKSTLISSLAALEEATRQAQSWLIQTKTITP